MKRFIALLAVLGCASVERTQVPPEPEPIIRSVTMPLGLINNEEAPQYHAATQDVDVSPRGFFHFGCRWQIQETPDDDADGDGYADFQPAKSAYVTSTIPGFVPACYDINLGPGIYSWWFAYPLDALMAGPVDLRQTKVSLRTHTEAGCSGLFSTDSLSCRPLPEPKESLLLGAGIALLMALFALHQSRRKK